MELDFSINVLNARILLGVLHILKYQQDIPPLLWKARTQCQLSVCFSSYGFAGDRSNNPNHLSFTKGKIYCFWLKRHLSQEQYYSLQSKTGPLLLVPWLHSLTSATQFSSPWEAVKRIWHLTKGRGRDSQSWGTQAFIWVSFRVSAELKGCHAKWLLAIY